MEQTFVALKPDAVQRGLMGTLIGRLEQKGFQLVGLKLMQVSRQTAQTHYQEHQQKPFFADLVNFMTSGPIVAMVWQGTNVVQAIRTLMGSTHPKDALPGTIRGDFAVDLGRNVIHGSDSVASAKREIDLFFEPSELVEWQANQAQWLYENPPTPTAIG